MKPQCAVLRKHAACKMCPLTFQNISQFMDFSFSPVQHSCHQTSHIQRPHTWCRHYTDTMLTLSCSQSIQPVHDGVPLWTVDVPQGVSVGHQCSGIGVTGCLTVQAQDGITNGSVLPQKKCKKTHALICCIKRIMSIMRYCQSQRCVSVPPVSRDEGFPNTKCSQSTTHISSYTSLQHRYEHKRCQASRVGATAKASFHGLVQDTANLWQRVMRYIYIYLYMHTRHCRLGQCEHPRAWL